MFLPLVFRDSVGLGWDPGLITDKFPGDADNEDWDHTLRTGAQGLSGKNAYFWVPRKNQNFWNWGLETSILTSSQARVYEPQFTNHYDNFGWLIWQLLANVSDVTCH